MRNIILFGLSIACLSSCNYAQEKKEVNIDTVILTDTTSKYKSKVIRLPRNRNSCFCDVDTLMNNATITCDTTRFSNASVIYWNYNCNRIWLTLENKKKEKFIIDDVPVEYYGYTYRLGYHLIKEFNSGLLFRSRCPANGPCIYSLIDKFNGKKLKEFPQLICTEESSGEPQYRFDFVIYLSTNQNYLIIENLDNRTRLRIPFKDNLTAAVPEQQFEKMSLENEILSLSYNSDQNVLKTLKINLNDKAYQF